MCIAIKFSQGIVYTGGYWCFNSACIWRVRMSFLTLLWIGEKGKRKPSKRIIIKEQKGYRVEPIGKKKGML